MFRNYWIHFLQLTSASLSSRICEKFADIVFQNAVVIIQKAGRTSLHTWSIIIIIIIVIIIIIIVGGWDNVFCTATRYVLAFRESTAREGEISLPVPTGPKTQPDSRKWASWLGGQATGAWC